MFADKKNESTTNTGMRFSPLDRIWTTLYFALKTVKINVKPTEIAVTKF